MIKLVSAALDAGSDEEMAPVPVKHESVRHNAFDFHERMRDSFYRITHSSG
jgi:hypothetical protein